MKKKIIIKPRNQMIIAAFKRDINLSTQVVKDKTKYNRKEKHKNQIKD